MKNVKIVIVKNSLLSESHKTEVVFHVINRAEFGRYVKIAGIESLLRFLNEKRA